MSTQAHILVRDLWVRYGSETAVRGIDLEVARGEFLCLTGRSGSGKSTLLYAISGFIPHTGSVQKPNTIGMVFQNYALYPFMTCEQNVGVGLFALKKAERIRVVREHLSLVGLLEHARKYPWQLSGGQAQRVAVARALANAPDAVFMDEPFAAVDLLQRDALGEWLMSIFATRSKTVLFVTHSIDEALALGSRVVVLDAGTIIDDFHVPFGYPRPKEIRLTKEFFDLRERLHHTLARRSRPLNNGVTQ
jgi:ABC-type nitrate/sulfonate/bicarbonate transport system ATPase subunit